MSKQSRLFVAVVLSTLVFSASAVPSVKVLGTKKSGANDSTTLKLDSQAAKVNKPVSRLGSVKSVGTQKVMPVSVSKATQTGKNNITDNRLSIGKYIHSAGVQSNVIKPAVSNGAAPSSDDFLNLKDKVQKLETEVALKQDALQAGDGIVIEGGVLSLSQDVDGLADSVDSLQKQLDDVANNYYTKTELTQILDEHGVGSGHVVWDADDKEYKYVTFLTAEDFSDSIFGD